MKIWMLDFGKIFESRIFQQTILIKESDCVEQSNVCFLLNNKVSDYMM